MTSSNTNGIDYTINNGDRNTKNKGTPITRDYEIAS